MSWVAVAIGGSAVIGAVTSEQASKRQGNAAQSAQNTLTDQQNQTRQDLQPWTQGGSNANDILQQLLGVGQGGQFDPNAQLVKPFSPSDLTTDPSYQWRVQQGENALLNNASALGGVGGGNTLKALLNYGQNAASQEYNNAYARYNQNQANVYNRLAGLSNTGASAAGQIANLGQNAAFGVGSLQNQTGATNAAGTLAGGNAANQGVQNWLLSSYLQQNGGSGGGSMLGNLFGSGGQQPLSADSTGGTWI